MKLFLTLFICIPVYWANGSFKEDVSRLRSGILTNYNPNIRPDSTVNVSVGLSVFWVSLDAHEETVTVAGKLTVIWKDETSWTPANYGDVEVFHVIKGEIWRPELVIENMLDDISVIADENLMYRLHNSGVVTWEPAFNIKAHCTQDFTYFPFDKQTCGVTVSSWSYDHSETPLMALSNQVNLDMYQENSEFEMEDTQVVASQMTETQATLTRVYSKLTFYITVQRHSQFYGVAIILPSLLLSALTTVTFVLPSETGERANYSVTVLLMMIVFYTMAFGYMPLLTGVSLLAVYAAIVLILATLATLCNLLVLYVYHQDKYREIKPSLRSVLHILTKITCKRRPNEDSRSVVLSEETTSSRLSEHDLQACSSLPNGGLPERKPGRLSPINRKVVPSETLVDRDIISGDRLTHGEPGPPIHTGRHSNTDNVTELMKMEQLKTGSKDEIRGITNIKSPWQEISLCLDRLFFCIFVVITFIVHFVFLILIGSGSS